MMKRLVEFYGGPMDGKTQDRPNNIPKGECGPWGSRTDFYLYDGYGRFIWTGTQEGHLLQAEVESKKRGGAE